MSDNDDTRKFLSDLETAHGGPITWKTFCTWFSDGTNTREYGVFMYIINSTVYYRDFERRPGILGFNFTRRDNSDFVVFTDSFRPSDIEAVYTVKKSAVLHNRPLKKAGLLARLFLKTVSCIRFKDGSTRFFEMISEKDFIAACGLA